MASGDTDGTGETLKNPIMPMMSLEPVITPIFTPVSGETPQQGGSTMTTATKNELRKIDCRRTNVLRRRVRTTGPHTNTTTDGDLR
ncbi:unnamed protein product [Lactuca virosa]|uniref:Uncharacterized protein n=1 Tax=Lactuca virosa TaxID=75947 RepID=A0AAU9M5P9_9ASTR|nr:unnamed protein product [Lactuca virosa]